VPPLWRNLGILALISAVLTALGRVSDVALGIAFTVLNLAVLAVLAYFGYTVWRQNRGTFSLMSGRLRVLLYGSVVLLAVAIATASFWVTSGVTALLFFVVVGGLGYVIYRVWSESRRYYY
jgi:hypothetical protein